MAIETYNIMHSKNEMRTTVWIRTDLLKEAGELSGMKTMKSIIDSALEEFVRRRKLKSILDLEGKAELSYSLEELLESRAKDVPD